MTKLLFILPAYAVNTASGAGQRTELIFQALQSCATVDVLLVGDGDLTYLQTFFAGSNVSLMQAPKPEDTGLWRLLKPLSPSIISKIAPAFTSRKSVYRVDTSIESQLSHDYDCVLSRYLRPISVTGYLQSNKVPVILDVDDRDDLVYRSRLNQPDIGFLAKCLLKWHEKQMKAVMQKLLPQAKHLWVTNHTDFEALPHQSKSILPNIPYIADATVNTTLPENSTSKVVLFVGTFGHRVNREAVTRFISECWPAIIRACPQATFRVVGSGGWESLRAQYEAMPSVDMAGFKEDLSAQYQAAAMTVVPIFEGGGTKIKVLESLLFGRACLVTDFVQQGYPELKHGESLFSGATEAELISQCIQLLGDSHLRGSVALHGKQIVKARYTAERFSQVVLDTVKQITS